MAVKVMIGAARPRLLRCDEGLGVQPDGSFDSSCGATFGPRSTDAELRRSARAAGWQPGRKRAEADYCPEHRQPLPPADVQRPEPLTEEELAAGLDELDRAMRSTGRPWRLDYERVIVLGRRLIADLRASRAREAAVIENAHGYANMAADLREERDQLEADLRACRAKIKELEDHLEHALAYCDPCTCKWCNG